MLSLWASLTGSRVGRWIAVAAAAVLAVLGIYQAGRRDARRERDVEDMLDHIETRRRMDDATDAVPDDVAAARGILRDRAKRGDGDL